MSAPPLAPRRALVALAALLVAACSSDDPSGPAAGPPPAANPAPRTLAVRVDVAAGTVTVLEPPSGTAVSAGRGGPSFALLGAREISATTSNFFRSAVGEFTAKKVRIRFDVAITNRSSVALEAPTWPAVPGTPSVMLFPFATTLTGGNGAIDASTDWDNAEANFFNDASCSNGPRSDCFRWEPYPAPFAAGATTGARTVGFDVDPTVQSFTTYFVLAADLPVPGEIVGTVSSPQRGPLGHVTVTLTPTNRFTGTGNTGGYRFDNVAAGDYTVTLSGLPGYCVPVASQPATVPSGGADTVNFSVACPYIAFVSDRDGTWQVYRMNLDGTGVTKLTNGTCRADYPTWSPDGTRIAYSCTTATSDPIHPSDIIVMNADGSDPVTITDGTTRNWQPDWGADGRIAFSSWRDGNDELYVMNADGSNPVRITQTPDSGEFQPSWSGDQSRIAYSKTGYKRTTDTFEPDGNNVWTINADGTGAAPLHIGVFSDAVDPAWSPVSNLVAFVTGTACCPNGDPVFTKDAVTGTLTQLIDDKTQQPANTASPDWSPDGARIIFAGVVVGSAWDLFVMGADGSGITRLTDTPASDYYPVWQP